MGLEIKFQVVTVKGIKVQNNCSWTVNYLNGMVISWASIEVIKFFHWLIGWISSASTFKFLKYFSFF